MAEEPPSLSPSESVFVNSLMLKTSPASDAEATASSPGGARADWFVTEVLENESSANAKTSEESSPESLPADCVATVAAASESALPLSCASCESTPAIAPDESFESLELAIEFVSSADAETQLPDHATLALESACASPQMDPLATAISALVAAS